MVKKNSILKRWGITESELTSLVDQNPSLRGILLGYVAEKKFHDTFLGNPNITEASKDDDHDRKRKGDRRIVYKGESFVIEVKSLQSNLVAHLGENHWCGKSQVDASDSREVTFPNGTKLKTTCLLRGDHPQLAFQSQKPPVGGFWSFTTWIPAFAGMTTSQNRLRRFFRLRGDDSIYIYRFQFTPTESRVTMHV